MKKPYPKWPNWTPEQHATYEKIMKKSTRPLVGEVGYILSREYSAGLAANLYYETQEVWKKIVADIIESMYEDVYK